MPTIPTRRNRLRAVGSAIAVAVFGFVSPNWTQVTYPRVLDLNTAVERALASDPQIRSIKSAVRAANAKIAEARSGRLPSVQLSQSFTRSNNPVFVFGSLLEQGRFTATNFDLGSLNHPNGIDNFRSVVAVRAPVFDQWKTRSQTSRAEIERRRLELQADAISQKLRFDLIRDFYGAVLARQLLKATDAAVRAAKENCRNTKNLVEVGMVSESDSLLAEVALATILQQQLEAGGKIITTSAALNIAIGNDPDVENQLTGDLLERFFPVEEQPELIRIAMERRPDYQQVQLAIEDGLQQTRSVRNEKLPRIDAFGSFGYSSPYLTNGSSDYTVGVNLTYTLFDPGRKARIEQSTAAEESARSAKDRLTNQITLEVITALQNFKTSRSKIQVSIKSVTQAGEALRILQDRYRSTLSTFEAVLAAEARVLQAKHDLMQARYECYISYASILLVTGRLTDTSVFD
jgi:outer membrane protein